MLVAPVAAVWSAVVGLVVVGLPLLLAWITNPHVDVTWATTLRSCGLGWLVAHDVPLHIGGVPFSLLPIGLLLIPVLLLVHSGRWAARAADATTPRRWAALTLSAAATYGLAAAAVAVAASGVGASADPVRALAAAGLVAVAAFGGGAATAGTVAALRRTLPVDVRAALRGGLAATAFLVAVAALLAALVFGMNASEATDLAAALRPGLLGGLLLAVLGLAYVPVAVVWALAYVLGPGFAIGTVATVGPAAATPPRGLPPFPLLAAVPDRAPAWSWVLLAVPVLAGLLAGVLAVRGREAEAPSAGRMLGRAVGAGLVAGLLVAGMAALASGSLGEGRLAHVGPSAVACGAAATGLVAFGALVGELLADLRGRARTVSQLQAVPIPDGAQSADLDGATRSSDDREEVVSEAVRAPSTTS